VKSPGTASAKTSGKKAKKDGKFPGKGQLGRERRAERREYKGEARREDASARREEADAAHRRAEAAHYQQEGLKAEHEGYEKEAAYDFAKARREEAEARRDMARARHDQAKARRDRHKAARVGLALPGARSGGWILGGNGWHSGCAAVALANHLLLSSGLLASDEDVLGLYCLTADDPGEEVSIQATLEAAEEHGLGGCRPATVAPWLQELTPLGVDRLWATGRPIILDLRLQQAQRRQPVWDWEPSPDWGAHAGVLAGGSVITWGRAVPVTAEFLARQVVGAWSVEWARR
jgi:hypothetical protein